MLRAPARNPFTVLLAVWGALGLASACVPSAVAAQNPSDVFARYAPSVIKIEVVEPLTSAPRSVGTGFFVDGYGPGLLVTNYHVVTDAVFETDRQLRLVGREGTLEGAVDVLAADPAHDLAIVRVDGAAPPGLELMFDSVAVGTRLFSIGHPLDLRTSVVEGIYNGPVEYSISPRFHFTGSINPGMSGGPTVTADGRVVGVNVSTAGNQLSFIIPAALLQDLLVEAVQAGPGADLTDRLTRRMVAFQDRFFSDFLATELETRPIGRVEAPVGPADRFDCGAEPLEWDDRLYDRVDHFCTTFDQIAWPGGATTPFIYFEHLYFASRELNSLQFHSLYTDLFALVAGWELPDNDEATDFACRNANIEAAASAPMKVVFCARRHESLAGLYDMFLRTALLGGDGTAGVVGTIRVFGISFDNAVALFRRVMGRYAWIGE